MPTMIKIQTITVGSGGTASIDFTSIPATYTDLCLKYSLRTDTAQVYGDIFLRVNNDTGTNYNVRFLRGNGTAASSQSGASSFIHVGQGTGNSSTASVFGNGEVYIPNYAGSNYKSASTDDVGENNAALAYAELGASIWNSTAAINRLTLYTTGTILMQYSSATLYGIKSS